MAKGTVNKAIVLGRLGKDPEIRYAKSGMAVGNLSIATNERVKDRDGNWTEETDWHTAVCFGKTAEFIGEYGAKGRLVYVEGRMHTNSWEDQDGQKKYRQEIIANEVQLVDNKSGNGGSQKPAAGNAQQDHGAAQPQSQNQSISDDDLPF